MVEKWKGESRVLPFSILNGQNYRYRRECLLKDRLEEQGLTRQECRIALLLLADNGDADICGTLFITRNTLKYHIRNLIRKLEIHSRRDLPELSSRLLAPFERAQEEQPGSHGRIIVFAAAAALYRMRCKQEP